MSSKGQYVSNPVKYLGKLYVDRTHGDRPNQVSSPAGGHPPRRLARSGCCRSRGIFIFFLLTLLWLSGCLCAAGAASEPRVLARRQPLLLSVLSAPACSPPPPCRTRAVWCLSLPGNSLSHLTRVASSVTSARVVGGRKRVFHTRARQRRTPTLTARAAGQAPGRPRSRLPQASSSRPLTFAVSALPTGAALQGGRDHQTPGPVQEQASDCLFHHRRGHPGPCVPSTPLTPPSKPRFDL